MSSELPFPHHTYTNDPAEGCFELITPELALPIPQPQPADIPGVADRLRQAGVMEIVLLHGTFSGDDALGLVREISRISPKAGAALKQVAKQLVDQLVGEIGNYTRSFADCLSRLINQGQQEAIPVKLFHWSGENHHLGRADGAISLLDALLDRDWKQGSRVQIWGHSHGGNALALMTNLLGASLHARRRFFTATRLHYRDPILRRLDVPAWDRVRRRLHDDSNPWEQAPRLDLVTFGTPLRYRWNVDVFDNLLHFVHHRNLGNSCPAQAAIPTNMEEILTARGGDYIQQLGIAGTNFLPNVFAWRSWYVEWRLQKLLQPRMRRRDLLKRLRQGQRVSLDGTTLLVDYSPSEGGWERMLGGHAVYTCYEWLPFHLREIANRFYQA